MQHQSLAISPNFRTPNSALSTGSSLAETGSFPDIFSTIYKNILRDKKIYTPPQSATLRVLLLELVAPSRIIFDHSRIAAAWQPADGSTEAPP